MRIAVLVLRWVAAVAFVIAGANHFLHPAFYLAIMPPQLPWHWPLVAVSGVAEIAGGLGLLAPATRRLAGIGLVALLIAVFPANIYMAVTHPAIPGSPPLPSILAWARLPFQAVFIAWVWLVSLRRERS